MDRIESFPVACAGGLVTNLPQLAQASQFPGTARELENFEPSVEGGYRRINGYAKWDTVPVSVLPVVWTRQAHTAGDTSINVADWQALTGSGAGTRTFVLSGTTYTVSNIVAVPGSPSSRHAVITFSPALASNIPARTQIRLLSSNSVVLDFHLVSLDNYLLVALGYGSISRYTTFDFVGGPTVNTFQNVNQLALGNYGTSSNPLLNLYSRIDGAGQTGTTLNIKNVKHKPRYGDTFWIGTSASPLPDMYVIDNVVAYDKAAGTATIDIYPSLTSSPADGVLIDWVSRKDLSPYPYGTTASYNVGDTEYIALPYGEEPLIANWIRHEPVSDLIDILDADNAYVLSAAYYRNHIFWASEKDLYFSAPFDVFDYSAANGAGQITIPGTIVGLLSLRDSLIIFCRHNIFRLMGASADSFALSPVTENTGCVDGLSIQEINGDVMFLSDTGISRLSDSDQASGLGFSLLSNTIKTEVNTLLAPPTPGTTNFYTSVFIPNKSQYRVFKYTFSTLDANTIGIAGTQAGLNPSEVSWSLLKGIKPLSLTYWKKRKKVVFLGMNPGDPTTGTTTYIYEMDSGNTFDGTNITATYSTPYYTFNDPKMRKNFLKLTLTVEPEGNVTTTVDTLLNYNKSDVIQPPSVVLGTTSSTYGDTTSPSYETLLIGNGESMSLKFVSNTNIPPYVIQSFTVEYSTNDRR
jgi:hypothetical protein